MTYLTPREVANHFKVSTRTVERLIERGELSCVRLGPKLTRRNGRYWKHVPRSPTYLRGVVNSIAGARA